MVKFYLRKINAEEMTLDDVPQLWYNKVKAELDKAGEE